ncbi:tail protein X [Pandoraea fibrosis]|uniref:Phage tail protein n=1 Tax=Pandoraea fibrosis TaxID=1891094 RepID=A0A5E4XFK5_9BURK|nr:tail protein X [Pandoraea fibrosis]VVE34965.1 phage tail protein [Pandoraea fibrosis]
MQREAVTSPARIVRTSDGDVLDAIVFAHYGHVVGAVEIVLEANRHLAGMSVVLPAGIEISLPPLPQRNKPVVRLWGDAQ